MKVTIGLDGLFEEEHDERSILDYADREASVMKFVTLYKEALQKAFPEQEIEVVLGEEDNFFQDETARRVCCKVYDEARWIIYDQGKIERSYKIHFHWDADAKTWYLTGKYTTELNPAATKEDALEAAFDGYLFENYGFPWEAPDPFLAWVHTNKGKCALVLQEHYGTFENYVNEVYVKQGYRPEPVETWEQVALNAAHHYRGDGGLAEVHQLLCEVYAKHTLYFANGLPKYELLAEVQDDPSVIAAVAVDGADIVGVVLNATDGEAIVAFEDRHAGILKPSLSALLALLVWVGHYRFIIFDYDGTLSPFRNGSDGAFPFDFLPNVREKLAQLQATGIRIAVASNQSGKRNLEDIQAQMVFAQKELGVPERDILWETDKAKKKPHPYMLNMLLERYPADRPALFVGDAESDKETAEAAGIDFVYAKDFFV